METIQDLFKIGMDRAIPPLYAAPPGLALNVGAGMKIIPDAFALDLPDWDADNQLLPFDKESVSVIHAYHFLEHIKDPALMLYEFQRVLIPGGLVNIVVPYYTSQMAAHDLDHKHAFCEETWKTLFTTPYYNKNKLVWKFRVHLNIIIGVVERNLCLMTQLIKEK